MHLLKHEAHTHEARGDGNFKFYHYDPTIVGGAIFAILFFCTSAMHFWQLVRKKCWFVLPLAIGGILELIGFAARCKSGSESPNWTMSPYIMQSILLLVAPALFAAAIYMELGRIVTLVNGDPYVLIRKAWLTKLFVAGDVLSFFIQGGGAGMQAMGTAASLKNGANIIIVGLFVQLLFFGFFVIVSVMFNKAMRRYKVDTYGVPWEKHMRALYISSFLIMVRSIFRAIEYIQGFDGYLLSHEAYLYVFDASLMFAVMALFNYIHPSEINDLLLKKYGNEGLNVALSNTPQRIGSHA